MFLATDLPRNAFTNKARGFCAGLARSNAASEGAAFVFYNPLAALLSSRTQLWVTKLACASDDEPQGITVNWSDDTAQLEGLTNVLSASNHGALLMDGTLDPTTLVAIVEDTVLAVTLDAVLCREQTQAAAPGLLLPLEYPLILPPGVGLVVRFGDRPSTSNSRLNVSWYRA